MRAKRVAIAGLGGVGGAHVLTLTRLGVGQFTLAVFDHFEIHNLNRRVGSTIHPLGRAKVDVLAELASAINLHLNLRTFYDRGTPGHHQPVLDADSPSGAVRTLAILA